MIWHVLTWILLLVILLLLGVALTKLDEILRAINPLAGKLNTASESLRDSVEANKEK